MLFVNFSFSTYTPPSCTCVLVVFHSISLIIDHSYSLSCRWWCRKFIFFFLHTIICMCHLIALMSCKWWCRKFIFFFLHTIICMCHLINIQYIHFIVMTSFICTKPPTLNSWCVPSSLITTLSFPFSLHMPLITTFSSGLWLCWSLITTFSLMQWVGGQFGRKKFLG